MPLASEHASSDTINDRWARVLLHRPEISYLGLFYMAYVLAGGFGQGLAIIPGVSITFWPPAGIFVATLLLNSQYSWPWWVLAGCLAELTCNAIWFHNPIPFALVYFLANALEAMAAAWLIGRFVGRPFRLESLEEVAAFVVLGAGVAPMVGATVIATTDAFLGKHPFTMAWPLVWLGDGTGLLVSTPLAVVAVQTWRERANIPISRLIEAITITLVLLGFGALAFNGALPTAYMILPPLLWASARFQLRGAAAALALITAMTAIFTVTGEGAFANQAEQLRDKSVMLQAFLGISAISALVVAALSLQHQQALQTLKTANAELETRVAERTANLHDSETRLRNAIEIAKLATYSWDPVTGALRWDARLKAMFGLPADAYVDYDIWKDAVHPEDRERALASVAHALDPSGDGIFEAEYRVKGLADGIERWVAARGQTLFVDGKPVGFVGTALETTERKRTEQALAEAAHSLARERERLAIALRTGLLGVYEWRVGETSIWWSPETYLVFGVDPATFTPTVETFSNLVHPDDRDQVWRKTEEAIANREVFIHEYRIVQPGGAVRWIANRSHIGLNADGEVERITGVAADVTERKTHEQQTQLLMREVNHRSKNMLSLVQSIARQTAAGKPKDFLARFQDRIQALAAAQDLLVHSGWKGVDLEDLVRSQLAHFRDLLGNRIMLQGPPITINSSAAQTLGLALHELATNAGKYGALSNRKGEVRISWEITDASPEGPCFIIAWTERGGPKVKPATRHGFGTTVIDRMSKLSLNATVAFNLPPEGLSWRLECLAGRMLEGGIAHDIGPHPPHPTRSSGQRVLVVEDETLVAFELAGELEKAGFSVLGPATSVGQAMRLLDYERCQAAVLDINLGSSTSEPIAQRLIELGVPFITVSGYSPSQRPPIFHNAPFLLKPLDHRRLIAALEQCAGASGG